MRFSYRLVLICACLLPITPSFFPTFACVQCSILTGELNALVRLINTIMGGTPYKDHREVLARLQTDYTARIGALQRDLAQTQRDRDEKAKALSAAQAKLASKTDEAAKAQTDVTRLAQELDASRKEKQQLEAVLHTEQTVKTKTAENHAAAVQTITQLQKKLAEAEIRIQAAVQELQQREKDLTAAKQAQALLQTQVAQLENDLKAARASVASLEGKLQAAEKAQQEALTLRLAAEKAQQEELALRVAAQERAQQIEAERKRLVAQLAVLKHKIAQEEGQLQREIARLTKENAKGNSLLTAERQAHEQTRSALDALQRIEADLKQSLLEQGAENKRLGIAQAAAQNEVQQLAQSLETAQKKIEALAEEERKLRARVRSLEEASRTLQATPFEMPSSLKSRLSALEKDLEEKEAIIRSLQQELGILRMGQAIPSTPKSPGGAPPFRERSLSRANSSSSPYFSADVGRLATELDDMTLALERTVQEFQAETTRAARLERALEVAQEKAALWEAAQKESEAEVAHWREKFQTVEQLSAYQEEELRTVARQLEESEKSNGHLKAHLSSRMQTLADTEEEKTLIAAELAALNLEHQKLWKTYERLTAQIVTLKEQMAEEELDRTALEEEYRFYQEKYKHDHAQLCHLQSMILEGDSEEAALALFAPGDSPTSSSRRSSRSPSHLSAENMGEFG